MRIAILGAGGAGACAALELANRGYAVDLYDENPEPLTRASRNNEGKVHLGLVYAKDPSLATARAMIHGAIHFFDCLGRWIDLSSIHPLCSTPFYYAIHKDTMTDPAELERHYDRCRQMFDEECSATGLSYLGRDRELIVEKISPGELAKSFAPDQFLAAYRTSELAVDVQGISDRLATAVRSNPRIRFFGNSTILSVERAGDGAIWVTFRTAGTEQSALYDHVANTLWHGRLEVDATFGLAPERTWIYRYKVGGWISQPVDSDAIPSATFVLGPFGDVVNFGRRGLYFSWYPEGMLGVSHEVKPPDWGREIPESRIRDVLRESFKAVQTLCPALRSLEYHDARVDVRGGVIFAWGATDIDHQQSRLHTRSEIGIHSTGNYHSVNTGKYTMIPLLGFQTAERILGIG